MAGCAHGTLDLHDLRVQPVRHEEEPQFQELMQTHHYLGGLPNIGETLRFVAR